MDNKSRSGLSASSVVTIVFVILKLTGVITWSWVWVLSPLWISILFWISLLILSFLMIYFFTK